MQTAPDTLSSKTIHIDGPVFINLSLVFTIEDAVVTLVPVSIATGPLDSDAPI